MFFEQNMSIKKKYRPIYYLKFEIAAATYKKYSWLFYYLPLKAIPGLISIRSNSRQRWLSCTALLM